ncbi:metallophosphoesterase family protein [Phenylobacterium sp. J367]|uniref:metallophosphoesterase family protein n=1 Tax=Phenylobacterium sp. J367 TaxID=2898435 RepID=UPI002151C5AD|nr:metallophosphoesterase family protein [Phenylobacterium sp. J367]MCR5878159.1 serine/threonine protein phosphatase [Phenylobacterium sp. J367]
MSTTGGALVYAVGDVHGCYDLMKALLADIAGDYAARADGRRPILVFLGDYVDRGAQSPKVLEALLWLRRRPDIEVRLLRGNHEQALLDFLEAPERGGGWLAYGGAETLIAYGVEPPEHPAAFARARDALLAAMPAAHLWLLQRLELMVTVGDYAFVHAGIRPGQPLAAQAEADLLWIRGPFLEAAGPHEKVIVHGHTWLDARPQLQDCRIGVDTGAFATGVLTAVRLDGEDRAVLQARAAAPADA